MKDQLNIVSKELLKKGKISNAWCIKRYITRLSSYIHTLRKEGWIIVGGYEVKGKKKTRNYVYYLVLE